MKLLLTLSLASISLLSSCANGHCIFAKKKSTSACCSAPAAGHSACCAAPTAGKTKTVKH